ncbi:phosphodiesterase [Nocardia sp. NPDC005366]|uniref:phosphodiesterase n=1 Tax=Nocardia sp. NPDC005366 TaxID=3156878 RepID=UPI0033BEBEC0
MQVHLSTLVKSVFDVGARVRHARVFHPDGIQLSGRFHADAEFEPWFGSGERAVIARISKGAGTPKNLPDVMGLAFRVLDRDEHPWDFALATTGRGLVGRFVITVARGWASAEYGALLPYRFGDADLVWLFAEPDPDQPSSASLAAMTEHLRDHHLRFEITASGVNTPPRRVGELVLHHADSHEHRTDFFDPILNHPADVALEPEMISRIREFAYQGSRAGRGEPS